MRITNGRIFFEKYRGASFLSHCIDELDKLWYKVTFIYRTGYKDDLYGCKTRYSNTTTNKKCSNSSDEVKAVCSNCSDDTCGERGLDVEETLILCGLAGFFEDYVPVFLAGKNVDRK